MKYLFSLLCLVPSIVSFSQNFQPWYPDSEVFYDNSFFEQIGLKTDSTNSAGTVLYLNKTIVGDYEVCLSYGSSMLGDSIVVSATESVFFNLNGEEIRIKHDLQKGLSWDFSDTLTAIVYDIKDKTILGQSFNVAEIHVTKKGALNPSNNVLKLEIAKGVGIVKTFDFNTPYDEYGEVFYASVSGITKAGVGVKNIPFKEWYSLSEGTIIHEEGYYGGQMTHPYYYYDYVLVEVLEKQVYGDYDSVYFKVAKKHIDKIVEYNVGEVIEITRDTIEVVKRKKDYEKYPGVFYDNGSENVELYSYEKDNRSVSSDYFRDLNCIVQYRLPNDASSMSLYKEIGEGFFEMYYDRQLSSVTRMSYLPVYYKTVDTEWGIPLDILTANDVSLNVVETQVYPTVSNTEFNFISTEEVSLKIYSSNGNVLFETQFVGEKKVDVKSNWIGLMYYQFINNKGIVSSGKLTVAQ